ncbi:hypothetical protein C8Q80DRAFT_574636 [Daedaleopsis nitida]|nr:hypothetical protein C8Q80DRAFT_574636 [Daedaleopsis nitida]
MAQKKAEVKEHHGEVSFVFVGNVSSSATESELMEVFKTVGPIRRLVIRACHGLAVPTAKLPRSFWGFGPRLDGIHYAIVHFFNPAAAAKAIELNQRVFMGRPLVVTHNFILLPEVEAMIKTHLDKHRKYTPWEELEYAVREALGVCKRLTYQKTEIISDPQPTKPRTSRTNTGVLHRATKLVRRAGLYGPGSIAVQQHRPAPFSRAEPNL